MKSLNLLSILTTVFLSLIASAQTNPQIRICNHTGGDFVTADTENDQVGLCKYDEAYVGTIDLINYQDSSISAQSLLTYVDDIQSCEPYGQLKTVQITEGKKLDVCTFADNSMIDIATLKLGRHAEENKKLNKALGL